MGRRFRRRSEPLATTGDTGRGVKICFVSGFEPPVLRVLCGGELAAVFRNQPYTMSDNQYHFISNWRLKGTCGEVAHLLRDPLALARWWPSVYLHGREVPTAATEIA